MSALAYSSAQLGGDVFTNLEPEDTAIKFLQNIRSLGGLTDFILVKRSRGFVCQIIQVFVPVH